MIIAYLVVKGILRNIEYPYANGFGADVVEPAQLGKGVDVIIDGGTSPGGTESTIVDLSGETPGLLREGAVPFKEIERLIQVESGSI